jgi:hypothetical protein
MPESSIDAAHALLVDRFLKKNGKPAHDHGPVTAIAIGVPPPEEPSPEEPSAAGERLVFFFDPSIAPCDEAHILAEAGDLAKPFVPTRIRCGPFEGLQASSGASIAPVDFARYNIPPVSAGTYGAAFQAGGEWYLLSSNHVLANNGRTLPVTPVYEPGPIDQVGGGTEIARFTNYVPLTGGDNHADCAWAQLDPPPAPPAKARIKQVQASIGMDVQKVGRSTGRTTSIIRFRQWSGLIDFGFGTYYFANQLGTWDKAGVMPSFAQPGDSGSIVTSAAVETQGVGLVCARGYHHSHDGEFRGYVVVICPLTDVIDGMTTRGFAPTLYAV